MNYELANQLKDAGFIQSGNGYYRYSDGQSYRWKYDGPDPVYVPALEELIEACGEKTGLFIFGDKNGCNAWKGGFPSNDPDEVETIFNHSTPTGAVARLWLALNKK